MDFLNFHAILKKPIEFINQFDLYEGAFQSGIEEHMIDSFLKEFVQQINSKENFRKLNLRKFSFFVSKLPNKFQRALFNDIASLKQTNNRGEKK